MLDHTQCSGCGLCVSQCKNNAIRMKKLENGFLYPIVNQTLCVGCRKCIEICPFKEEKSNKIAIRQTLVSYLFKHNADVRKESASGGFFTLLSDYVLEKKGVVYGAIYDEFYHVEHIRTEQKAIRDRMRGSKYSQSDISTHIYDLLVKDIESGRMVLFTGTPCQCAAVAELFGESTPCNLILMDLICHGVLSDQLFQEYIDNVKRTNQEHSDIIRVNLRDKELGWQKASVTFADGYKHYGENDFFYSFYSMNALQRESCFNCIYAINKRTGDFTVGDYWGMEKYYPEFYDKLGVSLLLVNSERAKNIMAQLLPRNSDTIIKEIEKREYEIFQPNLKHPTPYGKKSERFKNYYYKHGYDKALKKYFYINWRRKLYNKGYFVLRKIYRKLKK